jgi:uncharacterized protein YndB with AHSA1/START domain
MPSGAAMRNPLVACMLSAMDHTSTFTADVDEVWEVLTDPEGVESWLGEGSRLTPVEGADLDVADVETGIRRHGRVETVEPRRRLGFVWWPADDDGSDGTTATRVDIVLVPDGDTTHLAIRETPVARPGAVVASVQASTWAWRTAGAELHLAARRMGSGLTLTC